MTVPVVVLDACVLVNFSLCDTLLRLAEPPRLFEPKWTEQIMQETTRALEVKLGWPSPLTAHLRNELRAHFSEAWISGYEQMIPQMTNDKKDRHVLAAAVACGAPFLLTFNLRHFGAEHLTAWGVRALHPQSFLLELLRQEPVIVLEKLKAQASDRKRTLRQLLNLLNQTVPEFGARVADATSGRDAD